LDLFGEPNGNLDPVPGGKAGGAACAKGQNLALHPIALGAEEPRESEGQKELRR